MPFYCAKLLLVCLVEDGNPRKRNTCDHSFVIFRAPDVQSALERAMEAGKKQETRYRNAKGERVRWAFAGVEELRKLPRELDDAEVGSALGSTSSEAAIEFSERFYPRRKNTLFSED